MTYRASPFIALLCLLLSPIAMATTLKFGPDIELLVVDGQRMPSALFKSAESLELTGGKHQILFRVEKMLPPAGQNQRMYTTSPLVAVFDAKDYSSVTIKLPRLNNEHDLKEFERNLRMEMLNNRGNPVEFTVDVLRLNGITLSTNLEHVMQEYNQSGGVAAFSLSRPEPKKPR
ncbi:YccT family protein [Enterobacillus tribolii]|uniref:DUF2057 domain-containing protein n=1 Tax=Enterobacillus tribolii TaxID=1487935 RepID=A0A370QML6_9GAMM|nr:DUF2057 family protein [Enterobacillus tribolii]MBW7982448.1 DUF2057 domain-containing protein [Enterobacillus tribolii]RDK89614.1 hypothetical protein C8D90_107267 [Enterobacillus tribolii]